MPTKKIKFSDPSREARLQALRDQQDYMKEKVRQEKERVELARLKLERLHELVQQGPHRRGPPPA